MLVLTRKVGESLLIGNDIEVVVLEVRGDSVRIGTRAPRSVPVHRSELVASVRDANLHAASSLPQDVSEMDGLIPQLPNPSPVKK